MVNGINISQFGSLNFYSKWRHDFDEYSSYVQRFSREDIISFQIFCDSDYDIHIKLIDFQKNASATISKVFEDGGHNHYQLPILEVGRYEVQVYKFYKGIEESELITYSCIEICEDEELKETIKITYTHSENTFNTLFVNNKDQKYFQYRVEGGFLFSNISFDSDVESFRDQFFGMHTIDSLAIERKILTIGDSLGVPIWVGQKLNAILCCNEIYIDGVKHSRSDNNEIEVIRISDRYPKYNFKIELEEDNSLYTYQVEGFSTNKWILDSGIWDYSGKWKSQGIWK